MCREPTDPGHVITMRIRYAALVERSASSMPMPTEVRLQLALAIVMTIRPALIVLRRSPRATFGASPPLMVALSALYALGVLSCRRRAPLYCRLMPMCAILHALLAFSYLLPLRSPTLRAKFGVFGGLLLPCAIHAASAVLSVRGMSAVAAEATNTSHQRQHARREEVYRAQASRRPTQRRPFCSPDTRSGSGEWVSAPCVPESGVAR